MHPQKERDSRDAAYTKLAKDRLDYNLVTRRYCQTVNVPFDPHEVALQPVRRFPDEPCQLFTQIV